MTDRIRNILQSLERVREDLLALSDDIWLSIDHNDNDAMQEGVAFKRKYNERMAALDGRPLGRLRKPFETVHSEVHLVRLALD